MHACIYIDIYNVYICKNKYTYAYIHLFTYIHIHTYAYVHITLKQFKTNTYANISFYMPMLSG